jgi:hypothetical protein
VFLMEKESQIPKESGIVSKAFLFTYLAVDMAVGWGHWLECLSITSTCGLCLFIAWQLNFNGKGQERQALYTLYDPRLNSLMFIFITFY